MVQTYTIQTKGICAGAISFSIENGILHDVKFFGGCPGNTSAISKLLEGYNAKKAVELLKGNSCGDRKTSCADQLACGIEQAMLKTLNLQ